MVADLPNTHSLTKIINLLKRNGTCKLARCFIALVSIVTFINITERKDTNAETQNWRSLFLYELISKI